jgi:hypothetical protein
MFSGYLQAAIYKGLEGAHGLRGWQWLFIMNGVISVPIAVAGIYEHSSAVALEGSNCGCAAENGKGRSRDSHRSWLVDSQACLRALARLLAVHDVHYLYLERE